MPTFLLFRLSGPLASWGDVAVGEVRGSADTPGRTAILGLVGAALGIRASDTSALQDLATSVHVGVRTDDPGLPMTDFHTVQTSDDPTPAASRQALLRRAPSLWTVISRRDYRMGGRWTVILESRAGALVRLEAIASALRNPHFSLYLGRKSCPPGLPLDPKLLSAATAFDALADYPPLPTWLGFSDEAGASGLLCDPGLTVGTLPHEQLRRRDQRLDWTTRRFVDRVVHRVELRTGPAQEGE